MKYRRLFVVLFVKALLLLGCNGTSAELILGPFMRCPVWAQYNPESKCDVAVYDVSIIDETIEIDMSEYEIARMIILKYDLIIVNWENIRIETDQGLEVMIDGSRLLPGVYIIYNESDGSNLDEEERVYFTLDNPHKQEEETTNKKASQVQFEFVRTARPTPTPSETETED